MASSEQYAQWIVANKDKKGTPEFETVAKAYQVSRESGQPAIDAANAGAVNPVEGMTSGQRFTAGMGAGMARAARGVRGLPLPGDAIAAMQTGRAPRLDAIAAEEQQAREEEAPLMQTTSGELGNVAGTVAAVAPTALVPGAASLRFAPLISGATAAITTPGGIEERKRAGIGGAVGGGLAIGGGRAIAAGLRASGERAALAGAETAGTREAIRAGREAGFRLPPSEMAQTGVGRGLAQTAEWFSGRAAVPAKFSAFNQRRANDLVRNDIGLKGRGQITEADVAAAKTKPLAVYDEAAKVSPDAKYALEQWRATNDQLRQIYKIQNRNPTLDGKKEIERLSGEAESWLSAVDAEVAKSGNAGLAQRLKGARQQLGKIGTVENALNERGDIVSAQLYSALERGVPLSGGMKQAAKFAGAFPRYAQRSTQASWMTGSPPLGPSLGSGGAFLMGEPITAGALLAAPYATRNALLSRPIQRLAAPSINPGATRQMAANALMRPPSLAAVGVAGNALSRR